MSIKKLTLSEILTGEQVRILEFQTPTNTFYPRSECEFITNAFGEKINEPNIIEDVKVAAGEMIANAIDHGNERDPSKKIKLYCSWIGRIFYFVVQDEGKGFDINNLEYRSPPPPIASMGIDCTRQKTDLLYNFGDPASYVCKTLPNQKKEKGFLERFGFLSHKFL